ncbi:hypothetical protein [Hydrogenimonas sp.]
MKTIGKWHHWLSASGLAMTLLLTGCGGGGSSSSGTATVTGTAYYLDSGIEGVTYQCGSKSGVTGKDGSFTFEEGKDCSFYIGPIKIRTLATDELYDGKKFVETDIAIASLLQMLDEDGNVSNGIKISKLTAARIEELNLTKAPEVYDDLVQMAQKLNVTVPDLDEVKEHLKGTMAGIVKEWLAGKKFYAVIIVGGQLIQTPTITFDEELERITWTSVNGEGTPVSDEIPIDEMVGNIVRFAENQKMPETFSILEETEKYIGMARGGSGALLRLYRDEKSRDAFIADYKSDNIRLVTREEMMGKKIYVTPPVSKESLLFPTKIAFIFQEDGKIYALSHRFEKEVPPSNPYPLGTWTVVGGKVITNGGLILSFLDNRTMVWHSKTDGDYYYKIDEWTTNDTHITIDLKEVGLDKRQASVALEFHPIPIAIEDLAGKQLRIFGEESVDIRFEANGMTHVVVSGITLQGSWCVVDDYVMLLLSDGEGGNKHFSLLTFDRSFDKAVFFTWGGDVIQGDAELTEIVKAENTTDLSVETLDQTQVMEWLFTLDADEGESQIGFYPGSMYKEIGDEGYKYGGWIKLGNMLFMRDNEEIMMVGFKDGLKKVRYFDTESSGELNISKHEPLPAHWPSF